MSHVSTVEMELEDRHLPALKEACKELGLEFRENQTTFNWYGTWVKDYHAADAAYKQGIDAEDYGKCEHAIGVPGNKEAYEVGICRDKNGKLRLVFDFWAGGRGLCNLIGRKGEKLFQSVGKHKAVMDAKASGFVIDNIKVLEDGRVEIAAHKASHLQAGWSKQGF